MAVTQSLGAIDNLNGALLAAAPDASSDRGLFDPASVDLADITLWDQSQDWLAFSQRVKPTRAQVDSQKGATGDAGMPSKESAQLWVSSIALQGMHCTACALNVEDALRSVPGVVDMQVSAASTRALVTWDAVQTKPSQWLQALLDKGYRGLPLGDAQTGQARQLAARQMLWRLLVALFCMMQVMMYAWPSYTATAQELTPQVDNLLRWASWVISLPVLLFSCKPFFQAAWSDLRHGRLGMDVPVSLGMVVTFIVSTMGTFDRQGVFGQEVYFDSFTMFVAFLLCGRWWELRLKSKTAGVLEALIQRLPDHVLRQAASGQFEAVPTHRLRVKDVMRVMPGQVFAADGVILEGVSQVDEALLTGESTPKDRQTGQDVVAGSVNLTGSLKVRVTRVAGDTRFSQLVALMQATSGDKPLWAAQVDRLAKPFLAGVLIMALTAGLYWWPQDPAQAVMVAVAVLIVTCPCALSLATPVAMLASTGKLAGQGVWVQRLQAWQVLANVTDAVFDKTGTITDARLHLHKIESHPSITPAQAQEWAAALAAHSLHPVSRSMLRTVQPQTKGQITSAFDQDLSRLATQVQEVSGVGVQGVVAGRRLQWGAPMRLTDPADASCSAVDPERRKMSHLGQSGVAARALSHSLTGDSECILPQNDQLEREYLSAYLTDLETGDVLARLDWAEQIRPDAASCILELQNQGIECHVLSGDGSAKTQQVAKQLSVSQFQAGATPDEKLAYLRQIRAVHKTSSKSPPRIILMVGDGMNDGPALAGSDVSAAFGQSVALAKAHADVVVMGEQLQVMNQLMVQAKRTMQVVRQNLFWALAYNLVSVPMALMGYLPAWAAGLGMTASSLLVVGNAWRLTR